MIVTYEKNYLDNHSNNKNIEKYNKKVTASSINYFVVFRIGKKYKTINSIKQYQYHVLREGNVINADPRLTKFNKVLIGSENVVDDINKHIYGIKLRSNANLAIEMVLTVNHRFFDNLSPEELDRWIEANIEFLNDNFTGNIINATIHFDETSPHIHVLICPRFYNEDKKRYELSSNKYFGSKEQLRDWQTKYADHMHSKFNNLIRGVRGSPQKQNI